MTTLSIPDARGRAREYTLTATGPGEWVVAGGERPYRVRRDEYGWHCDCPSRAFRGGTCKHIDATKKHVSSMSQQQEEPMATDMINSTGEIVSLPVAMPLITVQQMIQRHNVITQLTKEVLKDGHDYGIIPGTGEAGKEKKTLLKPGAEKLCTLFGLTPDFQEDKSVIDFERGLFFFSYRCVMLRGASLEMIAGRPALVGAAVATGIGSANSRERKYRRPTRLCPECNAPAIKRSKYPPRDEPDAAPGWYCHGKAGGCGANFGADDKRIMDQVGAVNPDDAADLINTLQKMACKRSMIAATLIATNASEFFTQDLEDIEDPGAPPGPAQPPQNGGKRQAAPGPQDFASDEDRGWIKNQVGKKSAAFSKAFSRLLFVSGKGSTRRAWVPLIRDIMARLSSPEELEGWGQRYLGDGKALDDFTDAEVVTAYRQWLADLKEAQGGNGRERQPGEDEPE